MAKEPLQGLIVRALRGATLLDRCADETGVQIVRQGIEDKAHAVRCVVALAEAQTIEVDRLKAFIRDQLSDPNPN